MRLETSAWLRTCTLHCYHSKQGVRRPFLPLSARQNPRNPSHSNSDRISTMAHDPTDQQVDVLLERQIDAEYKVWKKNAAYLYDMVMTHSLEWPSLTVQWLPNKRRAGDQATEHQLLLGTHTAAGAPNYLLVAACALPNEAPALEEDGDENGDGAGSGNGKAKAGAAAAATKPAPHYDEERKEFGGFGHAHGNVGKIEIKLKVKHEGEVNRARYMPQNHFVVASRGPAPEVYIWDLSKHPSVPAEDSPFAPQGVCVGHTGEGYSMSWSPHTAGHLATGSDDQTVKVWNVEAALQAKATPGTQIQATTTLTGHTAAVEDVAWHPKDAHLIGSCGDDGNVFFWDTRKKYPSDDILAIRKAHDGDINCLAFNPVQEYLLATGGADHTVAIWDMRNLKSRVHTLEGHADQVYMVQWAPFNETILGSCSADRRVHIWDLSRVGQEQSEEDAEDGPPELLFVHGGMTAKVSDFSWNSNMDWTVASVAEDNILQVWNMAEEIYCQDDDEQSNGDGDDQALGDDELE